MKSIMEEASSISKAIENAWNRAGQPQEFSVKILEHPKTTFFGLKTEKSAKIAFFFNEVVQKSKDHIHQRPIQQKSHAKPEHLRRPHDAPGNTLRNEGRQEHPRRQEPREQRHDAPKMDNRHDRQERQDRPERPERTSRFERPQRHQDERRERRPEDRRQDRRDNRDNPRPVFNDENRDTWTPEMVQNAQEWVKETLVLMGKPDINVTPQVSNNYLKLSLDNSVNDDSRQEETQLKSWASLAMESLREKTNKPLRALRIVLESNSSRRT
jgi:hypothetical protein